MNGKSNSLIQKQRWQWGISLIVTSFLYAFTYFTTDIIFSTNDDSRIMYALAGYNTGKPYPYHPFINFFLGKGITVLYEIQPGVSWYGLFHVFCLFMGITVIGKSLLKNAAKKKNGVLIPVAFQIFLFFTVMIQVVVCMQFSTTPAVIGTAGVVLVLTMDIRKDKKSEIGISLLLSMIFLLVCFMTRTFVWYFIMCFYALAMFYQVLTLFPGHKKDIKKWSMILTGILVINVVTVFGIKEISLSLKADVEENPEFEEYNKYRIDFQDYGKYVDYNENPDFYNSMGWTSNNYRAVQGLLFFDEELNAENLKKITENYKIESEKRGIRETLYTAKAIFDGYRVAKTGMAAVIIVSLFCILSVVCDRKIWREAICAVFATAGYLLIYLLLAYRGRLPLRMFMGITIPASVFLAVLFMKIFDWKYTKTKLGKGAVVCGIVGMLGITAYNIRAIYLTDECTKTQTTTSATKEQVLEFEKYAIENKENVYVYDFSVATVQREPFVVYKEEKPTNCIISGGSYTFSTIYYKQLEVNNLKSLYWKDFLDENIYYVSAGEEFVELMCQNIEEAVGKDVSYRCVRSFADEGTKVYKFYTVEEKSYEENSDYRSR